MIMVLAVWVGLLAGLTRAWIGKRPYQPISLRYPWLALTATAPQLVAFNFPGTRSKLPTPIASALLISSQVLLLAFSLLNLKKPGMKLTGIGLILNLAAISTNGGWMPVSTKTVRKLWPQAPDGAIQPGQRLGWTKDKIQTEDQIHLAWLSDRILTPSCFKFRYAFSLGDFMVALGIIWLLWTLGGPMEIS
jgi:hypothetical protein